jgi:hypothetical protein
MRAVRKGILLTKGKKITLKKHTQYRLSGKTICIVFVFYPNFMHIKNFFFTFAL